MVSRVHNMQGDTDVFGVDCVCVYPLVVLV
jgi:hypothetical protein